MRKGILILIVLAVLAAAGLTVGLVRRSSGNTAPGPADAADPAALNIPRPFGFATPEYRCTGVIRIGFSGTGAGGIMRSREEARDVARRVHGMLSRKELGFGEAAERFSDEPFRTRKGDLGFVRLEDLHQQKLPGPETTLRLNSGDISEVIGGENAFVIYRILPFERKYFQVSFVYFGDTEKEPLSEDEARSRAFTIYNNVMMRRDQDAGPAGYIGEVSPGVPHKMIAPDSVFHVKVKDLGLGEIAPVFQDGQRFVVARRCAPIQFTFSFIMFLGNTGDPLERKRLEDEARQAHARAKDSPEAFYRTALEHYRKGTWNTPWYRVSKDLYVNELKKEVYDFLVQAQPGDISDVMVFDTAAVILLTEEFIPPR